MFPTVTKRGPMVNAASRAPKRSEEPATPRPTPDRPVPGTHADAAPKRDRRRPRGTSPNSRPSAGPRPGSSNPRGRDAAMAAAARRVAAAVVVVVVAPAPAPAPALAPASLPVRPPPYARLARSTAN